MRAIAQVLTVVLTVAYPVAIYWALTRLSARAVGLIALAIVIPLFVLRFRDADRAHLFAVLRIPLLILALLTLGAIFDDPRFVLAMPVLISLGLFATFAGSLRGEMPIIERFARMHEARKLKRVGAPMPEDDAALLSDAQRRHCRQATVAWCVFFVLNAIAAGVLALLGLTQAWAIYTGGIAYGLMGLLFAGEYVVRQYRFRDYGRGPHDRLLARLFPPPEPEPASAAHPDR